MDLELPTGFQRAEHADQSAAHAILGQDVAGDGLFIDVAGMEILHRPSASSGFSQGSFLQAFCDLLHMVAKVLEVDLVPPEIVHHPLGSGYGAKVSAKYQAVKA